jgi:antitoxin component YwqK of YwqJK toxin-antitoxin module
VKDGRRLGLALAVSLGVIAGACGERACGGLGGRPPAPLPIVKEGANTYRVLDKGAYKAYYDSLGQLVRILHDSNGDGRPDRIAHYKDGKTIFLIEIDQDGDGWIDRWEHYDPAGRLQKVGQWRLNRGKEDTFTTLGPDGKPTRVEYDDDGDGVIDRAEVLRDGQVVGVEIDADRNGRIDRWQVWEKGRLRREDLDTDGDGKPDRRITYDARGRVLSALPLAP